MLFMSFGRHSLSENIRHIAYTTTTTIINAQAHTTFDFVHLQTHTIQFKKKGF